jgi:superfamily II DNA/RNA helicase
MLDMGFIPDVEKIVSFLPKTRQTLFFSATMAPEIRRLSDAFLQNPKTITVSRAASVATTIVAGLALVAEHDKREALRRLIRSEDVQNALIFCNRKRDADVLHKSLVKHEFSAGVLHGDLAQSVRFATLEKFKAGEVRLLVCSDVAARGIDIGGLSHVFNFDVPIHAEDYVHRIGRTGRAGKEGHAYSLASPDDRLAVEAIEKLVGAPIPRIVIPGLDVVEWTEGKPKRGRGRGAKPAAKSAPEKSAPRPAPAAKEPRAPRVREPRPELVSEVAAAPVEAVRARAPEPFRQDRAPRDFRRRDDDLGPSVTGFGEDIPAFMLLPRRAVSAPHDEVA